MGWGYVKIRVFNTGYHVFTVGVLSIMAVTLQSSLVLEFLDFLESTTTKISEWGMELFRSVEIVLLSLFAVLCFSFLLFSDLFGCSSFLVYVVVSVLFLLSVGCHLCPLLVFPNFRGFFKKLSSVRCGVCVSVMAVCCSAVFVVVVC